MTENSENDLGIIPTEHMLKDLAVLLSLKTTQISAFAEAVNTERGFGIPKEAYVVQLVRSLSLTGDEFEQIYRISKYLYDRLAEKEGRFEDLFEALQTIAREYDLPSPNGKEKALEKLFSVPLEYQRRRKFEPYDQGIIHKISSIAHTHEVRAAFDDDSQGNMSLVGYIPIATIRLSAEDDKEEKQSILFTVDNESLGKLIERFTKIKHQLELVQKDLSGKGVELQ